MMNHKIKYLLMAVFFIAGICMAYMAGRLSSSNDTYSSMYNPVHERSPVMNSNHNRDTSQKETVGLPDDDRAAPVRESSDDLYETVHEETVSSTSEFEEQSHDSFRPDPYVLRKVFPDNRALPPVDREEFNAKQQEKERRNREYGKIAANKATEEEINAYYAEQTALAEDSAVILTYILTEYEEQLNETDIKKHEFLLNNFEKRLEKIPQKKAEALARLKQ